MLLLRKSAPAKKASVLMQDQSLGKTYGSVAKKEILIIEDKFNHSFTHDKAHLQFFGGATVQDMKHYRI